ncbi:hypothetical protein F5Y10DRAFT_272233 [Nemania abortiva]|nr:hypothetical protein F5Y10DRAFT_272233 [Nemania abortiva]
MAIIKDLPGLEATIQVDGKSLHEYDDSHLEISDSDDDHDDLGILATATKEKSSVSVAVHQIPHVVKYIEATPNKDFHITFVKQKDFDSRCDHLGAMIEIDGVEIDTFHEPSSHRNSKWKRHFRYLYYYSDEEGWRKCHFRFSHLTRVSADQCSSDVDIFEDSADTMSLGTIRILVYRMGPSHYVPVKPEDCFLPENIMGKVAEKALKGRALYAISGFGKGMDSSPTTTLIENNFQDPEQRPCAIFEFRYRTKDGLIEERILPRPTPIDSMSEKEVRDYAMKAYLEREKSAKKELESRDLKTEHKTLPNSSAKRPITSGEELPSKRYKETKREDGSIEIDLIG